MTGPHQNNPLDEKTKAKIVSLFRDHQITLRDLAERYGRSTGTIKTVLTDAGLLKPERGKEGVLERAFSTVLNAAISSQRCPMNDQLPGGGRSLSILARAGKVFVEVFVHNFRRVTILEGEHKGKTTANPPRLAGRPPSKPYLTIGLVKRRNGAVIPSLLDAGEP